MIDEDVIQYHILKGTEVQIMFEPHQKECHLKLISGTAKIFNGKKYIDLPQGHDFILSLWNCLLTKLISATECEFEIHGNHYINQAYVQVGNTTQFLFSVSQVQKGYVLILSAAFQLKIFVKDSKNDVQLEALQGTPEVLGLALELRKKYRLTPNLITLVNSRDGELYTVAIYGSARRVEISFLDVDTLASMTYVHVYIRVMRKLAKEYNRRSPVILVIGPEYVGKTGVCNFLLNKALEECLQPVHIDLDVSRNVSSIPGTLTLREVIRVVNICRTVYEINEQYFLQLGSANINYNNLPSYLRLVRRLSALLKISLSHDKDCAGAIIDMCGTLSKNCEALKSVMNFFIVDLVVVVGDEGYYDFVKNVLTGTKVEFVQQPRNIKIEHRDWEYKAYMTAFLKYFFLYRNIKSRHSFRASFSDFKVYKLNNNFSIRTPNNHCTNDRKVHFKDGLERVECDRSIENLILGVVYSDTTAEELAVAEIDYFVYFEYVDVEHKYAIIITPVIEHFKEKILILSDIKVPPIKKSNYQGFRKYVPKK